MRKTGKELDDAADYYNFKRPHWNLGCLTPVEYENAVAKTPLLDRKVIHVYDDNSNFNSKNIIFQGSLFN